MLIYRQAREDDIPGMASIRAVEWGTQEYWTERIRAYLTSESDPQHARKTRVGYVACDNGIIVGFITGHLTRRHGCDGELQWINVAQAYRGSEAASELLRVLAKWFVEQKSLKVCVDVEPTNLLARKFYLKHGAVDLNPHWLVWNDIGVVLEDRPASQSLQSMFRARFKKDIVAEFLPPSRQDKRHKAIVLCDGMPSIPRKQSLMEFLSGKGFWVFYPRYRGAWESGGQFLQRPPHEDILDVIGSLAKPVRELTFGQQFRVQADQAFVIGGSFGGAAAILCSLDRRVKRVVANCPVVDWSILSRSEKAETSNPNYAAYIREAFGNAYRLTDRNWNKLRGGTFYNPAHHATEIDSKKVLMFHAHDDPYVPYSSVKRFADRTGVKLKSFRRGGHLSTDYIVRKYWPEIKRFFDE